MLSQFIDVGNSPIKEHIEPNGTEAIRIRIDQYAAALAATPRTLKADERKNLIEVLRNEGLLDVKIHGNGGTALRDIKGFSLFVCQKES